MKGPWWALDWFVNLFQVGPYAENEIRQILSGKYDNPEPLYDKSIPGYPYTDRRSRLNPRYEYL